MQRLVIVVAVLTLSCAGTGPVPDQPWQLTAADDLDEAGRLQLERARAAQRDLGRELMAELGAAMDAGGPTAAIEACRQVARQRTVEVGERHGLRLGRTSKQLRNPANTAPAWARELVVSERTEATLLVSPDGRLGVLEPIRLQPQCEMCHGRPSAIAEEVQTILAETYPEDQATGFAAGDLRGWFWFEVPAGT